MRVTFVTNWMIGLDVEPDGMTFEFTLTCLRVPADALGLLFFLGVAAFFGAAFFGLAFFTAFFGVAFLAGALVAFFGAAFLAGAFFTFFSVAFFGVEVLAFFAGFGLLLPFFGAAFFGAGAFFAGFFAATSAPCE